MRILIFIFLFLSTAVQASFEMNERMKNAYNHIIGLEFAAAEELLNKEKNEHPNNGIIILYENYIDFLTIIIGEDEDYFNTTSSMKSERIHLLKDNDQSSPYYLYAQAEIHLQWAFARLKFEEYLTAAYEIQKAYTILEENQQYFPNFMLNKKGLGVLHTLVGAIPEQYQWVLNLVGMKGSVAEGLEELKSLLKDEKMEIYHSEILFLTSFLQLNMTNDKHAYKQLLEKIGNDYMDNYLLTFTAARLSHNLGQNDYCLNVLENRPAAIGKYPFYYLDYLQGMSYLYKLDYNSAKQYFDQFVQDFKGRNYIKSTYHKLAWISFLKGDTEKKNAYLEQVISKGSSSIDEDKVALKEAKRNYITHPMLLKARLLYDGGYYLLALDELKQLETTDYFSTESNNTEYWYRLARVQKALGFPINKVIGYYQESFEKGKNSIAYFAPMSALQIGFIYEKQNDFEQASIYFKKCLSISDFDYERGIHQKAKAGLDRIAD